MRTAATTHRTHKPAGFTLIELMITIAVAALLLGIAIPNFSQMMVRNQNTSYANELIGSINYARSEAIRTGKTVSICHSSNGTTCSGSWNNGWIVFVNDDSDSPAQVTGTDAIVRRYELEGLRTGYSLGADATFSNDLSFSRDGAATNTGLFAFCNAGSTIDAKAVVVTRLRPRAARDTDGDRIPNRDDGANIGSCMAPGA